MAEKDADPDDKDLMVTYYKSSGPGGQKKNKTESAVRIKHLPTGIIVTACESRSQSDNRERARQRLRERLAALNRRQKKRVATKPTRAAQERRLSAKARAGERKRDRGRVDDG